MVGEVVMKKINIILFMMISACSLYGCTQSSNSVDKLNDKSTEISSEYDDSQKLIADNNAEKEYEIPDKYDTVFWVGMAEDNSARALCYGDSGYAIYDLSKQEECASYETRQDGYTIVENRFIGATKDKLYIYVNMYRDEDVSVEKKGIFKSYGIAPESGDQIKKIYALNYELSVVDEYDVNGIFSDSQEFNPNPIGVCVTESDVWLANNSDIYKCDVNTSEVQMLDSKIEEQLKDITISDMVVSEDGSKLVFLGASLDEEGSQTYGIIDLNTAKVQLKHTETDYINNLYKSGDLAYITDGENPRTGKATGEIIVIDMNSMEISNFSVDNLESTSARIDNQHKYLITAVRIDDNNSSTKVRCHNLDTKDISWEYQLPEGKLINMNIVQDKIFFYFFRSDNKIHIVQMNLEV